MNYQSILATVSRLSKCITYNKATILSAKYFIKCFLILSLLQVSQQVIAQCPVGTQRATLDWDYKDFLIYTGNYTTGNGYLASNAWARTQNFTFGTQRVTVTHAYADASSFGENLTHTSEVGTYGTGADIQFSGNGAITFEFENEVRNVQFTVHDIDTRQVVQIDARNALNVSQNVTMATFAGTILTLANNGTATASATSSNTTASNAVRNGSVNIDIAGPVKRFTINISTTGSNSDPNFWISDINACTAGTFPATYYIVSRPFTDQPGYVLHSYDKSVYAVNPATGVTKLLFTDPYIVGAPSASNRWFINSMAYDPYDRVLYYVFSLTSSPASNTLIRKYDFDTETFSTVLADIRTIGVPLSTYASIESGAGAFYNGSYYIGIETSNSGRTSGRESVVWRIDFNGSQVPYRSSQAFALPVDDGGGTLLHDWADFAISDGVLYNFDGANGGGAQLDVYEHNLLTGVTSNFTSPTYIPGQNATNWNEDVYQFYALNPTPAYIAPYNKGAGTIGATTLITPASSPVPSLGDAAEAFRPLMDFGDAPASYDPATGDPAVHERLANLRLGNNIDIEWLGTSSALADADGADEDGLLVVPALQNNTASITYTLSVSVFNNTGANATLIGWLDYNFNGVFESGEGRTITVASSAVLQTIPLSWVSIPVGLTAATETFLRLRLAPAADGMTTAKMNGYVPNGEVEDYPVPIIVVLPDNNLKFSAVKTNSNNIKLNWTHLTDRQVNEYDIQRSSDGINWVGIGSVDASLDRTKTDFTFTDREPLLENRYYRLEIKYTIGYREFSAQVLINANAVFKTLKIIPNPARTEATILVNSNVQTEGVLNVIDYSGKSVMQDRYQLSKGANQIALQGLNKFAPGIYFIRITTKEKTETIKLIISR
jgi:hypothetical protein